MTTPLHSALKRALVIDGRDYVVTLSNTTLKLTLKGKRNGVELPWSQLVNGEAALAVALNASVGVFTAKGSTAAANDKAAANSKTAPAKLLPPAKPSRSVRARQRGRRIR